MWCGRPLAVLCVVYRRAEQLVVEVREALCEEHHHHHHTVGGNIVTSASMLYLRAMAPAPHPCTYGLSSLASFYPGLVWVDDNDPSRSSGPFFLFWFGGMA